MIAEVRCCYSYSDLPRSWAGTRPRWPGRVRAAGSPLGGPGGDQLAGFSAGLVSDVGASDTTPAPETHRDHGGRLLDRASLLADRFGRAGSLCGLGELAQQEGDPAAAMSQLTRAFVIYHQDGIELWQARTLQGMGAVASAIGDREAAQALW